MTIQPIHNVSTARDGLREIEPVHGRRKVADEHEHEDAREERDSRDQPEPRDERPAGGPVVDADGHVDVLA